MNIVLLGDVWAHVACRAIDTRTAPRGSANIVTLPGQATGVVTTADTTVRDAIDHFLSWRPAPVQPLEFPHDVHIAKQVACEVCHEGVTTGPVAGLPSVRTCVICHEMIATDRPRIKRLLALRREGLDFAWQRVYGFTAHAHVRFHHAAHGRAGLSCEICHGNVGGQTVAERAVDHTMGFCVNCHRARGASLDCVTCHN